jgi:hypothetical protein
MAGGQGESGSGNGLWRRALLLMTLTGLLNLAGCDPDNGNGAGGEITPSQTPGSSDQASARSAAGLALAAAANVGQLRSDIGPQTEYGDRGSVWAVDEIVKAQTGIDFNTLSTAEMYNELRAGMGIPVDSNNPPPGAIIISPAQGNAIGNVGIVGNNGLVYSNNSSDGTWEQNYTVSGWHDAFDGSSGTYAFILTPSAGGADYSSSATALSPDPSVTGGPLGGSAALGSPAIVTNSTAKIDTDGDPAEQGYDATWQPQTTGGYNSAQTPFVVVTRAEMQSQGASMGDWALVTNNATGQQTYARVGDVGPADGSGEISEAAATAVGIQYTKSSATVGDPSVTIQIYPGTRNLQRM